ncbi:MBL fold metallo-hydrolase [Actinosynnema sp. NPDC002837]
MMISNRTPVIERVEGRTMAVNSYLVEGPDGVVVVDAQLTVDDAARVRAAVDRGGRPLAGVLITHPHPDHYAGLAAITEGLDVPIVSTAAVDQVIRRDDALKNQVVGPMMGDQWPAQRPFPNRIVHHGESVELGGLTFTVRDLGAGESHADAIWALDDVTLFTGDVVYNDMHAFLADGHHGSWIEQLDELHRTLPDDVVLHVGHGAPGGKELFVEQRRYVEAFVDAVRATADRDEESRTKEVTAAMHRLVPHDKLLFLMQLSIEPVLTAIRGE